ncbi:GreA/GreB family elongation factor [Echinicola sp. 20G]|uniref:GreA/GreB family elongation factor n=1 Tax=Echinicola sp. 20G TaxID=2781961 RepID=UPI001910DB89|nr:GreA/GreB family elongation factor [Echinicola sp. 20G]
MKPLIRKSDYQTIRNILLSSRSNGQHHDLLPLENELKNCEVLEDPLLDERIVRLYSTVEVLGLTFKNTIKLTLVLPQDANIKTGQVSILAPLAVALIGYREGHQFSWTLPAGERQLRIIKVEQNK